MSGTHALWVYNTHMNESWHTYVRVTSNVEMSHGTRMNASCHPYEWAMSRIWISHVTHLNKSSHTHEWVMSHIWISHSTHMNESRLTHERVTSHVWMSHVTQICASHSQSATLASGPPMNESRHTHEWVTPNIWMSHRVTYTNKSRICTKTLLETCGSRTRPLKTSGYRPRLTHCGTNPQQHLIRSWWYKSS